MLRCRPDGGAMSHVDVCHDLGCDVAMSLRAGAMSHVRLGPERMSRGWVRHIARHRNIAPATSCATSHKACAMSLLRPRARGDRATSQTAWATSQHRTRDTGAHRGGGGGDIEDSLVIARPRPTSNIASDIAGGLRDVATSLPSPRRPCDIADCLGDIATSPERHGRPQGRGGTSRIL